MNLQDAYERRLITFHPCENIIEVLKILQPEDQQVYRHSLNKLIRVIESKQNQTYKGVVAEFSYPTVILWENYLTALKSFHALTCFFLQDETSPYDKQMFNIIPSYPEFIFDKATHLHHQHFLLNHNLEWYTEKFTNVN